MKTLTQKMMALLVATLTVFAVNAQKPSPELLSPTNHALVLIDHESQMAFAVKILEQMNCATIQLLLQALLKYSKCPRW